MSSPCNRNNVRNASSYVSAISPFFQRDISAWLAGILPPTSMSVPPGPLVSSFSSSAALSSSSKARASSSAYAPAAFRGASRRSCATVVVNASSWAYRAVTRAARSVSNGSYSIVSAGGCRDCAVDCTVDGVVDGRGCVSSKPLIFNDGDADVNVFVMYYFISPYVSYPQREGRGNTSSTNSRTRSRMGSGSSCPVAEGGKCRSSFWREAVTVFA